MDWCHIQKPENVKGGMCSSLIIRNGYSLALINKEEIFLIFKDKLLVLSLPGHLKAFQCLYIPLQKVKLEVQQCYVFLFFFIFQIIYFDSVVYCAGVLAGLSSQSTSGFGNALGMTGVSEV